MGTLVGPRLDPKYAAMSELADQTITTGAWATVTFSTEDDDQDGLADAANNRFVMPRTGLGIVKATVAWDAVATGERAVRILVGASTVIGQVLNTAVGAGNYTYQTVVGVHKFSANDAVTLEVLHSRGSNLLLRGGTAGGDSVTKFSVAFFPYA